MHFPSKELRREGARRGLDKKSFESKGKNSDVYFRKHETSRGILEKNLEK
jgi:hypothetical protein